MRAILFGWLVIVSALPGLALGFVTEVSLGWGPVDPADLNLFVGAVNGALAFFRSDLGAEGDVGDLALLDEAVGLGVGEGLEFGPLLGLEVGVFKAETATSGTFALGEESYPISLSLSLRNIRLGGRFSLPLLGRALMVGISGGMAQVEVVYSGQFPYPEGEWTFAYVPPSGEIRAGAGTFYVTGFVRAAVGVLPGLTVYLETGGHWQPEVPLSAPEGEVDLNGDGKADRVGFLGFWLAGGIQLAISF